MIYPSRPLARLLFLSTVTVSLLAGCAIGPPFRTQSALQSFQDDDLVVVGLTKAVRGKDARKNRLFWNNTKAVIDSLKRGEHPGLLGHAVRVEILGKASWTMTVWKDEESLNNFVRSPIHQKAIREGFAALQDANFARVKRALKDIPLSWAEVEAILTAQNARYTTPASKEASTKQ
ncbi:MAG: hypothetical protein AAFP88_03020 [Bacteroidota bacterium]